MRVCDHSGWLVVGCGVRGRPSCFCLVAPLLGFFMAFDFLVRRSPLSWNGFVWLSIFITNCALMMYWARAMSEPGDFDDLYDLGIK